MSKEVKEVELENIMKYLQGLNKAELTEDEKLLKGHFSKVIALSVVLSLFFWILSLTLIYMLVIQNIFLIISAAIALSFPIVKCFVVNPLYNTYVKKEQILEDIKTKKKKAS